MISNLPVSVLHEARYYLIHVFGKVASQTLEAAIRTSITASIAKGKPITGIFKPECTKHNDATIDVQQGNGPWRLAAPGPRWSYAASWAVSAEKELENPFLIEVQLRVSGGSVGIGCVTHDYSEFKGKEVFIEPAQTLQTAKVVVDDISGLGHLIIRNVDVAGSPAQVEVVAINVFIAEPAAPKQQSALLSLEKNRLSISDRNAILGGASPVRVERHHYLSDTGLANLEYMSRLPGIEADGIDGVMQQLTLARAVRADLDLCEPGTVWVLSGVRDPLDLSVAAFFQNLPIYCPWLDYSIERADYAADQLIEFFRVEFDRMLSAKPPRNFQEALLNLKLGGPEKWFDEEFRELYDVDVCELRMRRSEPFIRFRSGKFRFLIYRTELLSSAIYEVLRAIGTPPFKDVKDENVGREKDYSSIYRLFKQKFRPPSQIMDYYFGGWFSRNFYGK
jgi:Putative capsular polysaccharide synthesis protein